MIHGDTDQLSSLARGEQLAKLINGQLVVLEGAGHQPLARDPVRVNLALRDVIERSSIASQRYQTCERTRG